LISPEVYQQVVDKLVYFLMKRRLSNDKIDPEPPLFPWETEVTDYAEDSGDLSAGDADGDRDGHDKTDPPRPNA
jgi:hypothetical protein